MPPLLPSISQVTLLHAFDAVVHLATLVLGVVLLVVIMLRWFPRQLHPSVSAWCRFGALFLATLLVWLTIFNFLPIAAYGQLWSPGLIESFIQAAIEAAQVTGPLLLILIVFQASRAYARR